MTVDKTGGRPGIVLRNDPNYGLVQTPVNRPTSAAQVSLSFVNVSFRLAIFHR